MRIPGRPAGPADPLRSHRDSPRTLHADTARWAWRLIQLVLIAAVSWGVYRALRPEVSGLSWDQVLHWRPALLPLATSTLILMLVALINATLWRRIAVDLGAARPPLRDTIRIYFTAGLGRYLPGKVWQLAGIAVLGSRVGMPPATAAAAALLAQLHFLTSGFLFLAILLPRWRESDAALIAGILLGASATGFWILTTTRWSRRMRAWLLRRTRGSLREALARSFGVAARIRPSLALIWLASYTACWVLLGAAFAIFVDAFLPGSAEHSYRALAATLVAAYLWGYLLLIAPAGIGVREIAMTGLLAQIPGFPPGAAVFIPVASRIWFTAAEILPLAIVPLIPRVKAEPGVAVPPEVVRPTEDVG